MLTLHIREANIGSMFDPLKKISHHQKLGIGSYLGGHTKAQSEKMPKSYHFINRDHANSFFNLKKLMWAKCVGWIQPAVCKKSAPTSNIQQSYALSQMTFFLS